MNVMFRRIWFEHAMCVGAVGTGLSRFVKFFIFGERFVKLCLRGVVISSCGTSDSCGFPRGGDDLDRLGESC